jgi:hypothetical protein
MVIYLIFGLAHVFMAIFGQKFSIAIKEFLMTILFTIALNYLCENDLGLISWLFLFIPFILMTVFVIVLLTNSIDPRSGDIIERKEENKYSPNSDIVLYHDHGAEYDNLKHGIGIRNQHEIANDIINEKRNYEFDLDGSGHRASEAIYDDENKQNEKITENIFQLDKFTHYGGDIDMRHVRDQRLSSY